MFQHVMKVLSFAAIALTLSLPVAARPANASTVITGGGVVQQVQFYPYGRRFYGPGLYGRGFYGPGFYGRGYYGPAFFGRGFYGPGFYGRGFPGGPGYGFYGPRFYR